MPIITSFVLHRNMRAPYDAAMSAEVVPPRADELLPHPVWHEAADARVLATLLATWVAERLREGLAQRGQATLAISGGNTPVRFFQALSQADLDWAHVTVTLVDERAVLPTHADSNARLVQAHLLQGRAAQARWLPCLAPGAPLDRLDEACAVLDARLASLAWPVDVVVLGMGSDGHTASLFPRAPELLQALNEPPARRCLVAQVPEAPNVPVRRLSWTPQALLQTRHLVIHTTGFAKRALLQRACESGDVREMPIRLALWQAGVPCQLFHAD